jgi:hypothetical protein
MLISVPGVIVHRRLRRETALTSPLVAELLPWVRTTHVAHLLYPCTERYLIGDTWN